MSQSILLRPDWNCPQGIELRLSTRHFGESSGGYSGLNLGTHVNDNPENVLNNRLLVRSELPSEPIWLNQIHGNHVVDTEEQNLAQELRAVPDADACYTRQTETVLAILVADCLPVALVSGDGRELAVVHAGWRGLANGILEKTVARFASRDIHAWFGPAIGPCHYEVDGAVRDEFSNDQGFVAARDAFHWTMDLCQQAESQLLNLNVKSVTQSKICTSCDDRFYSHRQSAPTGRFGIFLWKLP
jgi:YfiH family protein